MENFTQRLVSLKPLLAFLLFFFLLVWESCLPAYAYFQGHWFKRLKHVVRNATITAINTCVVALFFSKMWVISCDWVVENNWGILSFFDLSDFWHFVFVLILLDLWMYWWHWLNHRIPFLWRFHKMHHSDPFLDVSTGARFHIGEMIFSSILRTFLLVVIGVRLEELIFYEIVMFAVVQFHHANIILPSKVDSFLRIFIPTPAMHKVHHSRVSKEMHSNFTSLFSLWDRLFGSFRLREDLLSIITGLNEYDDEEQQSVKGMLLTPFDQFK